MRKLNNIDISQGSVVTHLGCGGIYSDSIITTVLLILTVKSLKIGQYCMTLWRMKFRDTKKCASF